MKKETFIKNIVGIAIIGVIGLLDSLFRFTKIPADIHLRFAIILGIYLILCILIYQMEK